MTTTISVAHPTTTDPQQESTTVDTSHPGQTPHPEMHRYGCRPHPSRCPCPISIPSASRNASACSYNRRPPTDCGAPASNTRPPSRTSIINPRGLDKSLMQSLASCQWVREHLNILITGPTGVGKTWLACLAHSACRQHRPVPLPRLLQPEHRQRGRTLSQAPHHPGENPGPHPDDKLNAEQRRDLWKSWKTANAPHSF